MTMRTQCGGCGSDTGLHMMLDLGETPVANTLPKPGESTHTHPLQLGVCVNCWLVQQLAVVSDSELYGGDYGFYSSASIPKVAYHADLARRLYAAYHDQAQGLTVEIGCNDGDLLRHFYAVGCNVLGVDPAEGPSEQARTMVPVMTARFGLETARSIVEEHGKAGLIIANHVVAHVFDLNDFMLGVEELLADDGVLVIEVQYLLDLLIGNQLDHVYHEHRYHFSLGSLLDVVSTHVNVYLQDVRHTPAQSGSISATFTRKLPDQRGMIPVSRTLRRERILRDEAVYSSMQGSADYIKECLLHLIQDELDTGRIVAGYGAPAKATTLLNFCGITDLEIPFIVDTTPHKVGRSVPGTGIPIVAREWDGTAQAMYTRTVPRDHPMPDTWLLLVHNYLGDVMRREWEFTTAGGRWIVPIPVPVTL